MVGVVVVAVVGVFGSEEVVRHCSREKAGRRCKHPLEKEFTKWKPVTSKGSREKVRWKAGLVIISFSFALYHLIKKRDCLTPTNSFSIGEARVSVRYLV